MASSNNAGRILTGHCISQSGEPTFSKSRAKRLCNYCRISIYPTHIIYNLPLPLIDYYLPHPYNIYRSRRSKMPQNANQSLSKPQERHPAGSHRPSQAKSSHRQRHHSTSPSLSPSPFIPPHLGHRPQPNITPQPSIQTSFISISIPPSFNQILYNLHPA